MVNPPEINCGEQDTEEESLNLALMKFGNDLKPNTKESYPFRRIVSQGLLERFCHAEAEATKPLQRQRNKPRTTTPQWNVEDSVFQPGRPSEAYECVCAYHFGLPSSNDVISTNFQVYYVICHNVDRFDYFFCQLLRTLYLFSHLVPGCLCMPPFLLFAEMLLQQ
jgi:hypothetical protein